MASFLVRRLLSFLPVLFLITVISFTIMHLAPGKPTDAAMQFNPKVSLEARQRMEALYGLDQPLHVQYGQWLSRIGRLDFGQSFLDDRRVLDKIIERLPVTLTINLLSLLLVFGLAIPLGVTAAVRPRLGAGWRLILPVGIAAFGGLAGLSRYMRSSMVEVLRQDYIRTARAKGLTELRILFHHGLRNGLLPLITILGLSLPDLIGGSVIAETIFSIPGMGRLFYEAVMARDYPVVMALVTIGAVLTMLGNFLADVAYAYADPRIRVGTNKGF